jgi:hypothetical protein
MLLSFRIPNHVGIVQKFEWCLGPAADDKLKRLLAPLRLTATKGRHVLHQILPPETREI